jgi:flagellin-specific chaperone FliS
LDPLEVVEEVPTDLHQLYDRMVNQIQQRPKRNSEVCRLMLSIATVAYRPLHLAEIGSLCGLSGQISALTKNVRNIVVMCGSFLTVRDDQVYLIHQSAKDYLSDEARAAIFPSQGKTHYDIFFRLLELMPSTLQRDMYRLIAPGFPIDQVQVPGQDLLAITRYSCVHWVDHLCESVSAKSTRRDDDLQDGGAVYVFLKKLYLYWLEALSLCKSMSEGVVSMAKLNALIQVILRSAMLSMYNTS